MTILAGTGHRPDKLPDKAFGYTRAAFDILVQVASDALRELKPAHVISGMALGWDQALARAAVDCGIPFTAAVPFREQPNTWPQESRDQYFELLGLADRIVYVCDDGYAAWKMQKRNEWMCDHSDGLIVLSNGDRFGGTWNCLQYADRVGKPVKNVYPEWLKAYQEWTKQRG